MNAKRIMIWLLLLAPFLRSHGTPQQAQTDDTGAIPIPVDADSTDMRQMEIPNDQVVSEGISKSGRFIRILLRDGSQVSGELIAVDDKRLIIADSASKDWLDIQWIDVSRAVFNKKSHFIEGFAIGLIPGGVAGAIIGYKSTEGPRLIDDPLKIEGAISTLAGALVGAFTGGFVGAIMGADEAVDLPADSEDKWNRIVKKMQSNARYGSRIPGDS
ncbi:MAG: hypothetical protein JXR49_11915 [Acidobacteria bacterium]|nr:hypothetical protein [Acidobacteriota bacterium]